MSVVFHHVAIIMSNLKQAAHLYGDILGLEQDVRPDLEFDGLFYKLGNGQQLHLMQLDNPEKDNIRPEHGGRHHHFALAVPDLECIQAKLDAEGITYTASKSGRVAIFFYDMDGNAIELMQASSMVGQ